MNDHTHTPDPTLSPDPTHPLPDGWAWESVRLADPHPFVSAIHREGDLVYVHAGRVGVCNPAQSAAVDIRTVRVALEKHRGGHHPCAVALSATSRGGVAVITTGVPDPTLAPHVPTLAIVDGYDGAAASAPLDAVLAVLERAGKL